MVFEICKNTFLSLESENTALSIALNRTPKSLKQINIVNKSIVLFDFFIGNTNYEISIYQCTLLGVAIYFVSLDFQ